MKPDTTMRNALTFSAKNPAAILPLGLVDTCVSVRHLRGQEMISAFSQLFGRYQSFALTADTPLPTYQPSFFGRNLDELYVTLTARQ